MNLIQTKSQKYSPPEFLVISCDAEAIYDQVFERLYFGGCRERVIFLNANRMKNYSGMLGELSAAFQFPYYSGDSYASIADSLSDLDWMPAMAYKTIIFDADQILVTEPVERPAFFRAIAIAQENFWNGLQNLELSGRGRTQFKVVLHANPVGLDELNMAIAPSGFDLTPIKLEDI